MSSILNKSNNKNTRKYGQARYIHEEYEKLPKNDSIINQIIEENPNIDEEDDEERQFRPINDSKSQ